MSATPASSASLIARLAQIGAIQFGYFAPSSALSEVMESTAFAPVAFHFSVLPSYPDLMRDLAEELAVLVNRHCTALGLTHILAAPSVVPLATAVSLATHRPLVYPAVGIPHTIEGAYDFNVPTLLLTDILAKGESELAIAKRVTGLGLDVKAVVSILDLGIRSFDLPPSESLQIESWRRFPEIVGEIATPALQSTVLDWLARL